MAKRETKARAKVCMPETGNGEMLELLVQALESAARQTGITIHITNIHNPAHVVLLNDSVSEGHISREMDMSGDQFHSTGQVGIQGHQARAGNIVQNQVSNPEGNLDDLKELAKELKLLHSQMQSRGKEIEHDESALEVRKAAAAADAGNGNAVLEHLKKAGEWSLGIATAIGVPLAVGALKKALGFPA